MTFDEALAEAADLAAAAERRTILGITGPPGAGKSTLAGRIVAELGSQACVVPMDGFHLAQAELERLGRADRKGAPDTFDVAGYAALLRRLRDPAADVVYAPRFDRELEEPIGSAIPVEPGVSLVIAEGNYLLVWDEVASLLDRTWYAETPEDTRLRQLAARHVRHGKPPADARAWAHGSDQRNAELVQRTRHLADAVVKLQCE